MSEARRSAWRPNRWWLLVLAVWTVPGVLGAIVFYATSIERGRDISWGTAFLYLLPFWYLWALLTPIVVGLARRFPVEGARKWRNVALHGVLTIAFAVFHLSVGLVLVRAATPSVDRWPLRQALVGFVQTYFEFEILVYPTVLAAAWAVDYYRRSRQEAIRSAELEVQLAHAHLQTLRMQLQPHFLFNTLHAVSSLRDEDVKAARRMLARLSELLRLTLDTERVHEVPLEQELEVLELYLDIERERFSDRLAVEFHVDPGALDAMVPNLILQPLVENAVRHGVASRPAGGRISVTAERTDGRVTLAVRDDGDGAPPGAPSRTGVGLGNTRARLEELYGPEHGFTAGAAEGGGFEVRIEIPYRAGRARENVEAP
ncbi:MAG TPA: histidine kinase [Gemmatimonadota bacterium]|nr:histidine kinase [Gemmatimonadota bacterium]